MTKAQLKAQGYTPPTIDGDIYTTANGTIVNTSTNILIPIGMGTAGQAYSIEIVNDNVAGSGQNLYVRLNANTNNIIIVRAGESKTIDRFLVTAIYLTNSSGVTITYRINMFGLSN